MQDAAAEIQDVCLDCMQCSTRRECLWSAARAEGRRNIATSGSRHDFWEVSTGRWQRALQLVTQRARKQRATCGSRVVAVCSWGVSCSLRTRLLAPRPAFMLHAQLLHASRALTASIPFRAAPQVFSSGSRVRAAALELMTSKRPVAAAHFAKFQRSDAHTGADALPDRYLHSGATSPIFTQVPLHRCQ